MRVLGVKGKCKASHSTDHNQKDLNFEMKMSRVKTMSLVAVGIILTAIVTAQNQEQQTFRDVDDLCLNCICWASTGCQPKKCSSTNGQKFCGPYQISEGYWKDGGQPTKAGGPSGGNAFEECATDRQCSETSVRNYLLKYVRNCNGDTVLDCEDIARLHKAGPFACDQPAIESTPYWSAFLDCYYSGRK